MNVTELARQLKTTTSELFDKLPELGFDIGRRAIKVDDRIAARIIESWNRQSKKDKEMSRIAEIRGEATEEEAEVEQDIVEVKVPDIIVVREFADLLDLPVNKVLVELMKNGVLASMNERIDFDTASIVGEELGYKIVESDSSHDVDISSVGQDNLTEALKDKTDDCIERPPVVVVMGHVDHGKTKILDAIRKTDVVSDESGGITQHIGAYQVHKNDRLITFIDTPGHEAFTAMRSRGAKIADIAILVVAADDGIQPQTKEAIKIIQDAGLPFVVAINKMDKEGADADRVKKDLSTINLLPEDWGGSVVTTEVSALKGNGIDDLLETVLLLVDMDKDAIMADPTKLAIGTIIESHVDKGEGIVATILVQSGTLRSGDCLSMGGSLIGKVRILKDHKGRNVEQAEPGTPVKILGLKLSPEVGSVLEVPVDEKLLNKNVKQMKSNQEKDFSISSKPIEEGSNVKFINLIVKADVLGSVEAIVESLIKLETEEIKIKIVGKGLGTITEADVLKAEATGSSIVGFHIKPGAQVANLARDKEVTINYYEVIYHLIEAIEEQMEGMKEIVVTQKLAGKLEILRVFRKETKNMIVGGRVSEGTIVPSDTVIVTRDGLALVSGKVKRLESGKESVEKVSEGQECGVNYEGKSVIEEGDVLEFYVEEEKK
jgi:translation initiation factor IF-2